MGNLGFSELLLLLVFGLVVFGPQRLPEIARQVGRAVRELRRMSESVNSQIKEAFEEPDTEAGRPFPYMPGPEVGAPSADSSPTAAPDTPNAPTASATETPTAPEETGDR